MYPIERSMDNLANLRTLVENVKTNKASERFVRHLLEGVATGEDTPLEVIQRLGQCVVDYRAAEMKDEAAEN